MDHSPANETAVLSAPHGSLRDRYDVIIIGSGYGGGVSAARLARAGKRVCVIERGREYPTGTFPARFPELRQSFQVTSKRVKTGSDSALYDIRLGDDMHVLVGRGLGGGSLVNAGVALRPDDRVFADGVWPGQVAQDGLLQRGYARAERWLRPNRYQAADALTKVKALKASGAALGVEPVSPPVVVSFEETVNAAGIHQPACTLCGDCCAGCNVGAKNTVALTYLPAAKAAGAALFTGIGARHISRDDGGAGDWRVVVEPVEPSADPEADGWSRDQAGSWSRSLAAPVVIVAAGTLGSTELLLRSAARGLDVPTTLGERFSANGDIIAFGYGANIPVNAVGVGHPAKVETATVGAAVAAQLELKDAQDLANEMCIQEGVLPSAVAPVLPVMFVPNGRLLGALKSLVSGVYEGPFKHLQTFFAVSHDSASGRFTLDGNRLALHWPNAKDEPVYARLDAALEAIVGEAGGAYVKNPLGSVMGHQPATAHPLGGCAMGHDAGSGVVNHKGQVFRGDRAGDTRVHDGLYVIDGSTIPRSLGVNPLLTITALAERAMLHMASDFGLDARDVDEPSAKATASTAVA